MKIIEDALKFIGGKKKIFGETVASFPIFCIQKIFNEYDEKESEMPLEEIVLVSCVSEPRYNAYEYWNGLIENKIWHLKRVEIKEYHVKAIDGILPLRTFTSVLSFFYENKLSATMNGVLRYLSCYPKEKEFDLTNLFLSETFNDVFIRILGYKSNDFGQAKINEYKKRVLEIFSIDENLKYITNELLLLDYFDVVYNNGCRKGNCYGCPMSEICQKAQETIRAN